MWTYNTNFMGPMLHWYETNNIPYVEREEFSTLFNKPIMYKSYEQYAGGRIDCYCTDSEDLDYDPYGVELELPIMKADSFNRFSEWLHKFKSKKLHTFAELKQMYEDTSGNILDVARAQY